MLNFIVNSFIQSQIKTNIKIFHDALTALRKNYIKNFADQIIFIINYVIDELKKKPMLLKFISKNLSWGVYNKSIIKIYENGEKDESGFYNLFIKGIKENNINIDNPEVTLFMILELVSSTCFTSILEKTPLSSTFVPLRRRSNLVLSFLFRTLRSNYHKDKILSKKGLKEQGIFKVPTLLLNC